MTLQFSNVFPLPRNREMNDDRYSPLRIACYGFADAGSGSVAAAGNLILRELLERGYEIDFFNKSSFVRPRDLECYANYRYIDVPTPTLDWLVERCPKWGASIVRHVLSVFAHRVFATRILRATRRRHLENPYDLQLWLGDWAWGRIADIPVVSWVQGPPGTDARSIARHKRQIVRLCGWRNYLPLRLFAAYRGTLGLPRFDCTDMFIVGSAWSRRCLAGYGIPATAIQTLAYPVELGQFVPGKNGAPHEGPHTVLSLGRSVPRKRLDLFLDACARLIDAGLDLNVLVVGDFRFTPGYMKLIERFPIPERLHYAGKLPREQIIPLVQSASVVVQPSEEENFGSTVAEALACGTPVVLGPTNGTGDYIGSGGIRFAEYNSVAVADAIGRTIENLPALRIAARQAAEREFDTKKVTDDLVSLLHRAIARPNRQSVNFDNDPAPAAAQMSNAE
jgi:glycosyltransferase involved in cell wall biosynthesis